MVAEQDDDNRLCIVTQRFDHLLDGLVGLVDAPQIVVEDTVGLDGITLILGKDVFAIIEEPIGIGAVVLVSDREAEIGIFAAVCMLFVEIHQIGKEGAVHHKGIAFDGIAVFEEVVVVKTKPIGHIAAVVEPVIAGMAAFGIVALLLEVGNIGGQIGTVFAHIGIACDEGTLGIDGAAGEDIGNQLTADALGLQLMHVLVRIIVQLQYTELGEVVVGFQHDADDIDLLLLGNIGIFKAAQISSAFILVIAIGGLLDSCLDAVEEGIHKAAADILVAIGPAAEEPCIAVDVLGFIIKSVIEIDVVEQQRAAESDRQNQSHACRPLGDACAQQLAGNHGGRNGGNDRQNNRQRDGEGVFTRHIGRFGKQHHIGSQEGVVAQGDLIEVDQTAHQNDDARTGNAHPHPVENQPEKQRSCKNGQRIERQQGRGLDIGDHQRCPMIDGSSGKIEADQTETDRPDQQRTKIDAPPQGILSACAVTAFAAQKCVEFFQHLHIFVSCQINLLPKRHKGYYNPPRAYVNQRAEKNPRPMAAGFENKRKKPLALATFSAGSGFPGGRCPILKEKMFSVLIKTGMWRISTSLIIGSQP